MLVIGERYSSRTVPDGNGMIVLRLTAPATGSQKTNRVVFSNQGVYSQPQLELASTYDAALGGGILASSPATPCHSADAAHRDGDAR